MHVVQTPGVPPRIGSTILPIMGWTENSKRAARNIVVPNNQADPEILIRSLHQNGDPGIRRRGRLSARRSRQIFYNTRKGRDASGAGSHRRGTPENSVRVLPCHFTDGSAAACGSGNTCALIEKRSGVSRPGKAPWAKHLAPLRRKLTVRQRIYTG